MKSQGANDENEQKAEEAEPRADERSTVSTLQGISCGLSVARGANDDLTDPGQSFGEDLRRREEADDHPGLVGEIIEPPGLHEHAMIEETEDPSFFRQDLRQP